MTEEQKLRKKKNILIILFMILLLAIKIVINNALDLIGIIPREEL